jgi:hypothetical protein
MKPKPQQSKSKNSDILVLAAVPASLSGVPNHRAVRGLKRYVYRGRNPEHTTPIHIALHWITERFQPGSRGTFRYAFPHAHDCWEVGIFFPLTRGFCVHVSNGRNLHVLKGHKAIVIPPGVRHQIEAVKGEGLLLCILGTSQYAGSLIRAPLPSAGP